MKTIKTNQCFSNKKARFRQSEKGYSMVEIIIAMTIFLIITASIYSLLQVGRIDRNRASRRSDVMKNARVAIHLIGRDALNAGLGFHRRGAVVPDNFLSDTLDIPADTNNDRDTLTSIIAGNNLFQNSLQTDANARTDIVAFAFRDVDFSVVDLKNVNTPSGSPATARLQTNALDGATTAEQFDLYLIESDTSQVAVMPTQVVDDDEIDVAPGDPLGLNQPLDGVNSAGSMLRKCTSSADEHCTTYLATLKRFFFVSYKVKEDGTLVRIIYGNNREATAAEQIQEQPIAYNVQDLQFKYVLEDGTVMENPSVGADEIAGTDDDDIYNFNKIRQIVVSLTVLSTENDEQLGKPSAVTLNATFSARNLEYDAG